MYKFGRVDLRKLGQALKKCAKLITPKKRGADKERYVLNVLSRLVSARKPPNQIQSAELSKLRDAWAKEVSLYTIQNRHALLSHLYNIAIDHDAQPNACAGWNLIAPSVQWRQACRALVIRGATNVSPHLSSALESIAT